MTVGIIGLGLIGGSLARAYHRSGATVYAADRSQVVLDYARLEGSVAGGLNAETLRRLPAEGRRAKERVDVP